MVSINPVQNANSQLSEAPIIACNLPTDEQKARGDEVDNLFSHAQQVNELDDGYAFAYPASEEWAGKLLAFINVERNCCPFFTFEMVFEQNHGPLWLRLHGPDPIKEFIKAGMPPAFAAAGMDAPLT